MWVYSQNFDRERTVEKKEFEETITAIKADTRRIEQEREAIRENQRKFLANEVIKRKYLVCLVLTVTVFILTAILLH